MLTEPDLELLEAYLDDTLTVAQVQAVADRLSHDPAFAAALDGLRAERAARAVVWRAMQPTRAFAQQVAQRTVLSIHSPARLRFGSARLGVHAHLRTK